MISIQKIILFLPGEADEGMDVGIDDAGSNESIGWKIKKMSGETYFLHVCISF